MQKRALFFTVIIVIVFAIAPVQAKYNGGTGEPNNPYLIATPNNLNSIGLDSNDWDKHFLMINDINIADITGTQFNIIGIFDNTPFTGVFDGNNHSLSNYSREGGLFSFIGGDAEVKNLIMFNVNVSGSLGVGAMVDKMRGNSRLINCGVWGGEIRGLEGHAPGTPRMLGGLVGSCDTDVWPVDPNRIPMIKKCFAKVSIFRDQGVTLGGDAFGGLVGFMNAGKVIESCSFSTLDGHQFAGGLVGSCHDSEITDCYAKATVISDMPNQAGGLIGVLIKSHEVTPICQRSYSASTVNCSGGNCGGFIGSIYSAIVEDCFWDKQIDPNLDGVGWIGGNAPIPDLTGLSTNQMQQRSTFADAGWDMINIWDIGENQTYPFLRQYLAADINRDKKVNFEDVALLADKWLEDGTE